MESIERPRESPQSGILENLGIFGLDQLEPVILAALATEAPLLLVGPHGTGKSFLFERLSEALGLKQRCYNFNLSCYVDLVGHPLLVSEEDRFKLVYTPTSTSIWNAEAVFLDEIARCRSIMKDLLISIIQRKRVEGVWMDRLAYRWAGLTAPPQDDDDDESTGAYLNTLQLDPAIADLFSFLVFMPTWNTLSERQQESIARGTSLLPDFYACELLKTRILEIRSAIPRTREAIGATVAQYIHHISTPESSVEAIVNRRRAHMLFNNIIAVHAAIALQDPHVDPSTTAFLALRYSLPHTEQDVHIDGCNLLVAHETAWDMMKLPHGDPARALGTETDPVLCACKAAYIQGISLERMSALIADGIAAAGLGGRHALAVHIMESPCVNHLTASVAEQVDDLYATVADGLDTEEVLHSDSTRRSVWNRICEIKNMWGYPRIEDDLVTNLLGTLINRGELLSPREVIRILTAWDKVRSFSKSISRAEERVSC